MLSTPKAKGGLFLASSLCDGLEDHNIRQVATLLSNKDADPNILIPTHGVTPFHLVIGNDSEEFAEEVTKLFLCHGGNPNVRSNDGMTPVHVAAAWGRINILQLLLANGGDPLRSDNDGRTPFHYAFDGKYFKVVTMLSNYCESNQEVDDKPKYNMVLDKVLITNGDKVAEYVASNDTVSNSDTNKTKKNVFTDFHNFEPNSSSMIVDLSRLPDVCNVIETKCKSPNNLDECPFKLNNGITAPVQNNLLLTDEKSATNYSFVNLDFDFANLHLTDVMQKEKCLVSQIISHLSSTLASDCIISDTLHNYKRNKQDESSITTGNSDTSSQLKENIDTFYKYEHCRNSKRSSSRLNNSNKDILKLNTPTVKKQCSKYNAKNGFKKKYKKISEKVPLTPNCILDNSIISMSPNFSTPPRRRNMTPLTLYHTPNDCIISKSPNFATPVCTRRKINLARTLHVDSYYSPKVFKTAHKYKSEMQSEFSCYKKHVAQSTPRRKKRSIYKFRSGKKRFNPYRYESDATSDEPTANNILLKPVDLDKTIFSANENETSTIHYDILTDMSSEYSSACFKKCSKAGSRNCNNHFAKLNDGRYEDGMICDNSKVNLLDSSFSQMEKESESTNSSSNDEKCAKFENNQINNRFVTVRKNIFKVDKKPKTIDIFTDNIKSACTTESDSLHRENIVDCVDCDTKKLLNEDINVNISKTCKLHAKNLLIDKFCVSPLRKLTIENNSSPAANLPLTCRKHIYLPERSCSSRMDKNNANSKMTEDVSRATDLDVCKIENSSLLSYVSAQEEYKYEDPEEGVTLLQRRLCVIPFSGSECDSKSKMSLSRASSSVFAFQNLPEELHVDVRLHIDDATLRTELRQLGDEPGPITNTTRQIYLKRLMRLRNVRDANVPSMPVPQNVSGCHAGPSNQIEACLQFADWPNQLDTYKSLEKSVFQEFSSPDPSRRWREGTSKTSFTYLLLDPRVTQDLPNRSAHLPESEVWSIFLRAIFYIGKGKRSRPLDHLYDAFHTWVGTKSNGTTKINRILDIWNNDHGVICLHVFQNIIPVEAYTREAAMIDAIGRDYLANCKGGDYYGIAATWSMQQKQKFGRYLLHKAMKIYVQEGENQVFPQNLG